MNNNISLKDLYDLPLFAEKTLDFGTFTITVKRRESDWWACLNGNRGNWNCAKTLDFVVGYMVLTHYNNDLYTPEANHEA